VDPARGPGWTKDKVILAVQARKLKSDGCGNQIPMPLNDYIDIGVFAGKKDEESGSI
jgi:ABC-2 type transport system permease protein